VREAAEDRRANRRRRAASSQIGPIGGQPRTMFAGIDPETGQLVGD
jgi:hypothetical protein